MRVRWYVDRLRAMDATEIRGRVRDEAYRRLWKSRPPAPPKATTPATRRLPMMVATLPAAMGSVSPSARQALLAEADEMLAGRLTVLGRTRSDVTDQVDYHLDIDTGRRAPAEIYCFDVDIRDDAVVGNAKFVWELARHQHLTTLAAAYAASNDARYAERIDRELRNYWSAASFPLGMHWTSGIEVALRLISWTWIRRMLDGWPGATALFENNEVFVENLGRSHQWLATLGSHGSSANNHLIAEASGQFIGAAAFGLFEHSDRWRDDAAKTLADQLELQTHVDGLNREQAADYHGFVLDLALVAWVEAELVGHPVADRLLKSISVGLEALQSVVDAAGRPPRFGDSDDGLGWRLDALEVDRWASLLDTADALLPETTGWVEGRGETDVRNAVIKACVAKHRLPAPGVPADRRRRSLFHGAGLTILRDLPDAEGPELWCSFDHGPHGYLATAAHAHADALAVEIRVGGVEIVADPGTYCYNTERRWRDHFRSTAAHATVTVNGRDQSSIGGAFLWTSSAETTLLSHDGLEHGELAVCRAEHDGYRDQGVLHRRTVELDRSARTVLITDHLPAAGGPAPTDGLAIVCGFPLGPDVTAALDATGPDASPVATLRWPNGGRATAMLDPLLSWTVVTGQDTPPIGWYSPRFGAKQPAAMLAGRARLEPGAVFSNLFEFGSEGGSSKRGFRR